MLQVGLLRDEVLQDVLRENLAELHAPLVERVNVPDHALREDLVLVGKGKGQSLLIQ